MWLCLFIKWRGQSQLLIVSWRNLCSEMTKLTRLKTKHFLKWNSTITTRNSNQKWKNSFSRKLNENRFTRTNPISFALVTILIDGKLI